MKKCVFRGKLFARMDWGSAGVAFLSIVASAVLTSGCRPLIIGGEDLFSSEAPERTATSASPSPNPSPDSSSSASPSPTPVPNPALSITADQATLNPGDTATLTLTGGRPNYAVTDTLGNSNSFTTDPSNFTFTAPLTCAGGNETFTVTDSVAAAASVMIHYNGDPGSCPSGSAITSHATGFVIGSSNLNNGFITVSGTCFPDSAFNTISVTLADAYGYTSSTPATCSSGMFSASLLIMGVNQQSNVTLSSTISDAGNTATFSVSGYTDSTQ